MLLVFFCVSKKCFLLTFLLNFCTMILDIKNVFRCNDDTWKFQAMIKGKKYRKSFKSKTEAEAYARTFFDARKMDLTFFSNLSGEQLKDIKEALAILPEGKTLHEAVERAWRFCSTMDM